MKCKIPEISWHNRDPVLSVDIQPNKCNGDALNNYRLASGGTDAHVLIWYMKMTSGKKGDIELDLAADLTRHQRAVNVVKFSPNGELLASGDDESVVFIWKLKLDSEPLNILETTNEQDKEVWITLKVLRGHMEDIYDLSWAPNSLYLVSGSVDNSAIMWDIAKGKPTSILKDHKGFVQGVAWDPKNQYIATLSTDRYLRIFDIQSKRVLHRISKGTLPVPEDSCMSCKNMRLFHDDTLQTFFRRLCFSPDGKLLLTPAGVADYDGCIHPINTTYVFSRYAFRQPAIVLPCPDQYTVAVSCCPLLFCLRPHDLEKNPPVVPLPYRMIFAVATKSSVYFYDTQQKQPFALISNIHYTRLTDLTWSQDGLVVVVSSTDGFCSLITFEKGELGEVFEDSDAVLEAALAQVNSKNGKSKKQKENDNGTKSRKPSLDGYISKENTPVQTESILEKINENNEESLSAIEATTFASDDKGKTRTSIKAKAIAIKRKSEGEALSSASDEAKPIQIKPNSPGTSIPPEKPATPIAIKRKPDSVNIPDSQIDATNGKQGKWTDQPKANPIPIKRRPGLTSPSTSEKANPIPIKSNSRDGETSTSVINDTHQEKLDEGNKEPRSAIDKKGTNDDKTEYKKPQTTPKANPIQIKRKPGVSSLSTSEKAHPIPIKSNSLASSTSPDKPATPIAIKRKPTPVVKSGIQPDAPKEKEGQVTAQSTAINAKPDGETAISVINDTDQEKLDDGNKETTLAIDKTKGTNDDKTIIKAIPIPIKRTQGVSSPSTREKANPITIENNSGSSLVSSDKPATPIAIKRKPTPVVKSGTLPDAAMEEEGQGTAQTIPIDTKFEGETTTSAINDTDPEKLDEGNKETTSTIETTSKSNDDKAHKQSEGVTPHSTSDGSKPIQIKLNSPVASIAAEKPDSPIVIRRKPTAVDKPDVPNEEEDQSTSQLVETRRKPEGGADTLTIDEKAQTNIDGCNKKANAVKAQDGKEQTIPKVNPMTINSKPEGQVSPLTRDEAKAIQIQPNSRASSTSPEKPASPFAIKRKPTAVEKAGTQPDVSNEKEDQCTTPKSGKPAITSKVLTGDIILDKEILSSEEKFESPEKKCRPVTPISVRRHPRTPSQTPTQASQSPTSFAKILNTNAENSNTTSPKQASKLRQEKKATPIAVRRTPRSQTSTPIVVNAPNIVEEALDAWTLAKDGENDNKDTDKCNRSPVKETGVYPLPPEEATDRTEDIRLVYEDTVPESLTEAAELNPTNQVSKSNKHNTSPESKAETNSISVEKAVEKHPEQVKTPKRVTLRTISTPKSKKKLIE